MALQVCLADVLANVLADFAADFLKILSACTTGLQSRANLAQRVSTNACPTIELVFCFIAP